MALDLQPRARRGLWGTLWALVDGTRRLVMNLLFVLVLVGLVVAGVMWARSGPPALKDKTVLVLNLAGPLVEQRSGSARSQAMAQVQGETTQAVVLRDVLAVLDAAATDPQITSVLLMLDGFGGAGLPAMNEVAGALNRFKAKGGKKVVAWGGHYDQRQYYLAASAADEVLMHPMGSVLLTGFGSLRNYYKDAFDRLGVAANVIRVGKYKNFGEPYFANAPSPATLEADAALYGDLWAAYTGRIEKARKLGAGSINQTINNIGTLLPAVKGDMAQMALQAKLIDGLKTQDELRTLLAERGAPDDDIKSFRQINYGAYLSRLKPAPSDAAVGVVVAQGSITEGESAPGGIGGKSTADLIRQARDDKAIKVVLLRVNSPGGSAFGSELVRRELELTRTAGKPVVVSMGDVAASGGYWISTSADEVLADASTITGSIGVFAMLPTADGLMAKVPVHTGGHGTTWLAHAADPRLPLDPKVAALVQASVGHIYDDFLARAAKARNSTPDKINDVAQGRVWTGEQARQRGLVDGIASYTEALAAAAKRAKLADGWQVRYIERPVGRLSRVLDALGLTQLVAELSAPLVDQMAQAATTQATAMPAAWADSLAPGWQHDLAWLGQVAQRREPFAAVVHCLCAVP
jgi:protease-4